MSGEQVIFAIAAAACAAGAVVAVSHPNARAAAAALMTTLVALAVLYAGLVAPVVAAIALAVALFATIPLVVHFTVTRPHPVASEAGPRVAGAAVILCAALLAILGLAVTYGELPVNVSVRSSDGYDLAGLRDLLAGRAVVPLIASLTVVIAALVGVHRPSKRVP